MQKAKIGISVGFIGAAMYLLSLIAGYTPTLLVVGYVLLAEEDAWLKRTAVKAMVMTFLFSLAGIVLSLVPEAMATVSSFLGIFGGSFYLAFIANVISFFKNVLGILEILVMGLFAVKALAQQTLPLGPIDDFINKVID